MKISTIAYIVLLSSLVACEKNKSLWEISPCGFTSDDELATLRESRSFKIIDSKTFKNIVDTVNVPIHPDSVRLFDYEMNLITLEIREPKFSKKEWEFSFFPYSGVPYNDDNALLDLNEKIFYLATSVNDLDTITEVFEKCRLVKVLFNDSNAERPQNDLSEGGVTYYFIKQF